MKKMMDSGTGMKPKGEMSAVMKVANVGNSQEGHGGTGNYNSEARKGEVDTKDVPRTGCYDSCRDGR